MTDTQLSLDSFRHELNTSLAVGTLSDFELLVTDAAGERQVVVALGHERVEVLFGRLQSVGGYANVFVLEKLPNAADRVVYVPVMPETSAIHATSASRMTGDDKPSPNATVSMFLEFLRLKPEGVIVPLELSKQPVIRDSEVRELTLV